MPSGMPSPSPSFMPVVPTAMPSPSPTVLPTTPVPSQSPSLMPSPSPSTIPSTMPTPSPTALPTTPVPSISPSLMPSPSPSTNPSTVPTPSPSRLPTTLDPTPLSAEPTLMPTSSPTLAPTIRPTNGPTDYPTTWCMCITVNSTAFQGTYLASGLVINQHYHWEAQDNKEIYWDDQDFWVISGDGVYAVYKPTTGEWLNTPPIEVSIWEIFSIGASSGSEYWIELNCDTCGPTLSPTLP